MFEKLKTKKNIRNFFIIVILMILVLFLIRILFTSLWLPTEKHTITPLTHYFLDIIDKFVISLFVTVGVAAFIFYLTKDDPDHDVVILDSEDIGGALKKAMKNTDKWYFNGASGSYTRAQTLPFIAKLAGKKNITIPINILLLNPLNIELCKKYANYRNSLEIESKFKGKTIKSVQTDILATIISCYAWKEEQPRLNFKIGLKDNFSILRTDLSHELAIITKEDPRDVALAYRKDSVFYNAMLEEMNHSIRQITSLDFNVQFTKFEQINQDEIINLLDNLNINLNFNIDDYDKLIKIIKERKNPYAN
jgi:hypothetical protein